MRNVLDECKNYKFCQYYVRMKQFGFRSYLTDATRWQSLGLVQHVIGSQSQVSPCSQQALYQVHKHLKKVKDIHLSLIHI